MCPARNEANLDDAGRGLTWTLMFHTGPVYTPLQPASRPADNMDDWSVGALPLHGRANMPAEMGPAYGESSAIRFEQSGRRRTPAHQKWK